MDNQHPVGDIQGLVAVGGENYRMAQEGQLFQVGAQDVGVVGVQTRKGLVQYNQAR